METLTNLFENLHESFMSLHDARMKEVYALADSIINANGETTEIQTENSEALDQISKELEELLK